MVPDAPSAGQRARQLQRRVRRGRRRRLADVLRPRRRRQPDGQRGARRRHRRRAQPAQGHPRLARRLRPGAASARSTRPRAEYYLSLEVVDQPGVLHAVTGVFARHGVSIRAAEQEGLGDDARLVFITHEAQEAAVQATRARAARPRRVRRVGGLLRVIGG